MNLYTMDIIPGAIIDNKDPNFLGRVKCAAPGLFDSATMSKEILPWIYPFGMSGNQAFSMPIIGSKVWILKNTKNINEYWYIPMFEYTDATKNIIKDNYENNPEILLSRTSITNTSSLTFDDANGFNMNIGKNNVNLKPSGDIDLKSNDVEIKLNGSSVIAGNPSNNYENAALGNTTASILSSLENALNQLALISANNPFTQHLVQGFKNAASTLSNADKIVAKDVKIS